MKFCSLHHMLFAATLGKSFLADAVDTTAPSRLLRSGRHLLPTSRHLKKPVGKSTCAEMSIVDVQYEDPTIDEEYISCETPDGKFYKIKGVSADEVKGNKQAIINGDAEILLPDGAEVNDSKGTIELPNGKKIGFKEKPNKGKDKPRPGKGRRNPFGRNRRDLAVTGDFSVLVVRVIAADGATTQSQERLSDSVFGNGADGGVDGTTLKSHYTACSYGALNFVEAADRDGVNGNGKTIRNGSVTVTVSTSTAEGDGVMNNAIIAAFSNDFGTSISSVADHVMFCLPPNTMNGIAYANINSWRSVYSDNWCTYLSAQMHEIGHNLGLAHANEQGTYKDQSGMMGYSYSQDNGPIMCFNGAKSWQLGWYGARHLTFNQVDGLWNGRMIGQVDLENTNAQVGDKVLIKLNINGSPDYFLQFNRQSGTNSGTREGGNQVMLTRAGGEGLSYAESELLAKMSAGGSYTLPDFNGSGQDLGITVNSINTGANPAFADVTIFAGCVSDQECDDGNTCNGVETCNASGQCEAGEPDQGCCGNAVCEADEDVFSCPSDCTFDCGQDCNVLTSTFASNNGSNGNIFKVQALQDVVVTSFVLHTTRAESGTVKIWTKPGDYAGFESNAGAWENIMNESFQALGSGQQTSLAKLALPVLIPSGTFCSFYVHSTAGVRYTNGSGEGNVFSTNPGELTLFEGKGVSGEIGSASIFTPRVWNGIIEYGLATSGPAPTPPPTPLPTPQPTSSPTPLPTPAPSPAPSPNPTKSPTVSPMTSSPTSSPNKSPSTSPTPNPSKAPSPAPTSSPVASTGPPSVSPTPNPTKSPTVSPTTSSPTSSPNKSPSTSPTPNPTKAPSPAPTKSPALATTPPTNSPSSKPSSPPSKAPSLATPDRMVFCGVPNKCGTGNNSLVKPMDEPDIGVRCCTTDPDLGWPSKCSGRTPTIYGESNVPQCYRSKTFTEARDICALAGGRLCSGDELIDRCTRGTGCQMNRALVWGCSEANVSCQTDEECCDGSCGGGVCV